jgi:hypothetical protein
VFHLLIDKMLWNVTHCGTHFHHQQLQVSGEEEKKIFFINGLTMLILLFASDRATFAIHP